MDITKKILIAFTTIALINLIVGIASFENARRLTANNVAITLSYDVIAATSNLISLLKDAETGQRGYLLTGRDNYLEPYNNAAVAIPRALDDMRKLLGEDKLQAGRVDRAETLANIKLTELKDTIVLRKTKGLNEALAVVLTDKGKQSMDEFRRVIFEIESTEKDSLARRNRESAESTQNMNLIMLLGTGFTFVLLATIGYALNKAIVEPIARQKAERKRVTGAINESVNILGSASTEILAIVAQGAAGAQEQAAAIAETVSTVAEVAQTSTQSAQQANLVATSAQQCDEIGRSGQQAVDETVAKMGGLKSQSELMAESIVGLAEQAQAIGEIIALVDDIAEQTNILALNAAIEASRAGDHGKGFTVVATEVKALATQSKKATAQVRQILTEIQKATNSTVIAAEEGTKTINHVTDIADRAGESISDLVAAIGEATRMAFQIAGSASQQATAINQIQVAIQNINEVTQQNLAATRQAERTAQDLALTGGKLQDLVRSLEE
jgi:methyl-accepting chemotaxis protein